MSVGRNTLTATMKKTWKAIKNPFRRQRGDETNLCDDYPSLSESEFTDDEERRREWQRYLNRRASIISEGVTDFGLRTEDFDNGINDKWEYESEYDISFGSDDDIIDAFQGQTYDSSEFRVHSLPPQIKEESSPKGQTGKRPLENERHVKPKNTWKNAINLQIERNREDRGDRSPRIYTKTAVKDRIKDFERGPGKRRDSIHPQLKITEKQTVRRESSERESVNQKVESCAKRKIRKPIKHRKRMKNVSTDESDVETVELKSSKHTVNLTMEDLHDIIKQNVSSAVKTIVSAQAQERKIKGSISPVESFTTESETIFSGSSSHSTDANLGGLLQKQIKAQLDKDKLKGFRRASVAVGNLQIPEPAPLKSYPNSKRPSISPLLTAFNQQQPPQLVVQDPQQQQQHIPQVTFNLTETQPVQHSFMTPNYEQQSVMFPSDRRPSVMPTMRRPSLVNGAIGNIELFDSLAQTSPPNHTPQLSPQINAFNTVSGLTAPIEPVPSNPFLTVGTSGIPQEALNRLRMRRHTLAAIGVDNPLSLERGLDQLNALSLLNASINHEKTIAGEKQTNDKTSNGESKPKSDSDNKEETDKTTEPATRPLTIAEQIQALTNKKKKKKPLKPGQMGLTGCSRAMLILTNLMFLLVGAGSLGVGVWMLMDPNIETYFDILNVDSNDLDFKMICYILCSIGAFVLFIGFMGCCGTIRSSKCMLTMFIILIGVITLMEAGFGTLLILHKDSTTAIPVLSALLSELGNNLKAQLTRSLIEKYDPETTIGSAWDLVQIQAECCGSNGPEDYKLSAWKNLTNDKDINIPDTCCVLVSKDAPEPEPSNMLLCQAGTVGFFHDTGCFDALLEWFKKNSSILVAALITVLAIEIFSLICAIIICRKAHKDAEKYKDTPGLH